MSKIQFISSKPINWVTPFPTIGEVVRVIANVLETKKEGSAKDYDRLARGEIFKHEEVKALWDGAFKVVPDESVSVKIQNVVGKVSYILFVEYMRVLWEGISSGYSRENIMYCLNGKIAYIVYHSMVEILDGRREILNKIIISDKPLSAMFEYNKAEWDEFRKNSLRGKNDDTKNIKENVYRWMEGEQTPRLEDLYEVIKRFCKFSDKKLESVYSEFFCAKIIANVARYERFLDELRNIANGKRMFKDECFEPLERTLYRCVGKDKMEKFDTREKNDIGHYLQCVDELRKELRNKMRGDKDSFDNRLRKLEERARQLQHFNICWWQTQRLRAYWYVLSGKWDMAKECYEEIADITFYTGDADITKKLFEEVLVLAAILKDKPLLKKLKHLGITFGFFGEPYTNQFNSKYSNANKESRTKDFVVEDSEVKAWASRFYELFPRDGFFCPKSELPNPVEFSSVQCYIVSDMPQEADIKNKNKIISLQHLKYPQIVWFADHGPAEEVEKLLKAGADVNALSSSSESALLLAITSMDMTLKTAHRDIRIFEMLSQYPHERKTLETLTDKKRLSVLGSAVETGNLEIVNTVIKMMKDKKANIDIKYGGDDQTPLYTAISLFKASDKYLIHENDVPPELFEDMRRQNVWGVGLTTEETRRRYMEARSDPHFSQIIERVRQYSSDICKEVYTPEKILKIIEELLKVGSNPNEPHNWSKGGLKGYTPLMLAAEFDWVEAFDLLVKHGGDVEKEHEYIHNRTGEHKTANCWKIALHWKAHKVFDYMGKNCKGNGIILMDT